MKEVFGTEKDGRHRKKDPRKGSEDLRAFIFRLLGLSSGKSQCAAAEGQITERNGPRDYVLWMGHYRGDMQRQFKKN